MTSRRDFIKISLIGAGVVAAGAGTYGLIRNFSGKEIKPGKIDDLFRTPTYCEICFWKCAGWVYKSPDGSIWKVTGNDEDQHCNGRLCPRGTGGIGAYYDSDRLRTPLIRTEERGRQVFREATWDEALDYTASKMKEIASRYGPHALALFLTVRAAVISQHYSGRLVRTILPNLLMHSAGARAMMLFSQLSARKSTLPK